MDLVIFCALSKPILVLTCDQFLCWQVLTRFVASSSPVIYWFAGGALLDTLPSNCDVPDSLCQLGAAIFQRRPKESHSISNRLTPVWVWLQMTTGQLIVCYFCVYYFIGCVVHCNFLPWTWLELQTVEHWSLTAVWLFNTTVAIWHLPSCVLQMHLDVYIVSIITVPSLDTS